MPEYTTGEYGATVAVVRRPGYRNWYLRAWDAAKSQPVYRSAKTRDLELAKRAARLWARQLEDGSQARGVTLGRLMRAYLAQRTPQKGRKTRQADRRRAEMWQAVLGVARSAERVSEGEWLGFVEDRASGRVDGRGVIADLSSIKSAADSELSGSTTPNRSSVLPRTVQADCAWLKTVYRWGVRKGLVERSPVEHYPLPPDRDPRRPLATRDRFEATMEHAGKYGQLPELLTLAVETGRRLSAILNLKREDLRMGVEPHGAIRWPGRTDKMGRSTELPISEPARKAILRCLAHPKAKVYLFPNTKGDGPIHRSLARDWLEKAERAAKLEPLDGSLWHAYRRMWATERKHLPTADVAYYGGWKGTSTLESIYQRPDDSTLLRVATDHLEVREK